MAEKDAGPAPALGTSGRTRGGTTGGWFPDQLRLHAAPPSSPRPMG